MPDQAQNQGRETARHFRRLYLVALSLIAALAIGGQVLVQYSLSSQRGDGHVVNMAGYQRMLSQRITLKLMLHDATDPEALVRLTAMRDRWLAAHEELAGQVPDVAYGETARETLAGQMREAGQPLRHIASLVTQAVTTGGLTAAERAALMADQELFLPLMDAVVLGFEHSVQARVTFLQRVEFTLLIITLVVLALEAALIFRPAVNRLQSSLDQLELSNRQSTRRLESLQHLAGGIAHSFNNLLTAIMGHADLARHDALHHGRSTEYVDAQIGGCRRAAEIISHLVTYSGHGQYDCTPTALGPWLAGVLQTFAPGDSKIRLRLDVTDDAVADVDRPALKQAMEGILVNAVEAMKDQSGTITVRLTQAVFTTPRLMSGPYRTEMPAGFYACIQVIDEGKGIAPEDFDRIFDPYYTRKEFGRGLGLASVLGIAHGHGGGIVVESAPGNGAKISLFIPLANSEARSPGRSETRSRSVGSV